MFLRQRRRASFCSRGESDRGFTLIEIIFVILIIAIISSFGASQFQSIHIWRQRGDIREFVATWELLYQTAITRGHTYRLIMDLDDNSYTVRREIYDSQDRVQQVDYLKNLRTKSEQERRAKEALERELGTIDEAFEAEDRREGSKTLEQLFIDTFYIDPEAPVTLGYPLEFPNLAERKQFPDGLALRDVKTLAGKTTEGSTFVRFSPRGASEFAVVHLTLGEDVVTVFMNPSTGVVSIFDGDKDFEWTYGSEKA